MQSFIELALSFPHTEQVPHFDRLGFKVTGRRMFATYLEKNNTANVFLSPAEQKIFCQMDKKNLPAGRQGIYPVPNKWGNHGATTFELNNVSREILLEALLSAYNAIINSKTKKRK
jgi:hypothetical protein